MRARADKHTLTRSTTLPHIITMSAWHAFRQNWLKPDIYPLIAIMASALSLGTVSFIHTARNPAVHWDSTSRRRGVQPFHAVEHTPYIARFKNTPSTIFDKDNAIWDTLALTPPPPAVFVVRTVPASQQPPLAPARVAGDDANADDDADARVVQRAVDEALGYAARAARGAEEREEEGVKADADVAGDDAAPQEEAPRVLV